MAGALPALLGGTSIETARAVKSVVHFAKADLGQEQQHVDHLNYIVRKLPLLALH